MLAKLLDRYKSFWRNLSEPEAPDADFALNQIYLQLHQVQRRHSLIEVVVDGDDVIYQSMILALDPEEKTILIDELFPTGFVGLAGQLVDISVRLQAGKMLKFQSEILQNHNHDGSPLYVLTMPEELHSDQRRNAYRLPISRKASIQPHFIGPDQQAYHAKLRNLSSSGVAMEVELDNADEFHYNDHLTDFDVDFAGLNIGCDLAIRNVEVDELDERRVFIGASFIDLPAEEQRLLERSIMRIQRERLQYSEQAVGQVLP